MGPYRTAGGGFFDYEHQADKEDCDQVGVDTFAVHIANPLVFASFKHTPDSVPVATGLYCQSRPDKPCFPCRTFVRSSSSISYRQAVLMENTSKLVPFRDALFSYVDPRCLWRRLKVSGPISCPLNCLKMNHPLDNPCPV